MKKIIALLWIVTFSLLFIPVQAQEINTQGRDFWLSFLPNGGLHPLKLEIHVAGRNPCSGVVTNPRTGWSQSFTVTPGVVTTISVPASEGLVDKENKVMQKAIHVTATDDVSLYASNYFDASYDAANILPTAILLDKYMVQSYYSSRVRLSQSNTYTNSRLLIVATENDTKITIDSKGGLRGVFPPYAKKEIMLNAGECYLCLSAMDDISGTVVNAKNGKKIAVFSGCDTQIPFDCGCCIDAVFEQSVPMANWGRHFVVTASALRKNDVVRITSLAPDCKIWIDGKLRKTLGDRKSFDYKLYGDKREAVYISTSSPVAVSVFLTSSAAGGSMGDPSMVNINPIEQQMDKVTFATYNTARSQYHYVNIVTQTNQLSGMALDGNPIASEFLPVPQKEELSYARISIAHGSHTLESENGGFVAHVYGLGPDESYAYSVGSNSKVLNKFDEEGNLIMSLIPDDSEDDSSNPDPTDVERDTHPEYIHTDTLPALEFDGLTLNELKHDGKVRGYLMNGDSLIINPEQFDVTAHSDMDYLFEKIDVNYEYDTIELIFHTRAQWCDCFIPNRLRVDVVLTPINLDEEEETNRIVIPIIIPITKENPWIARCLWVVVAWLTLLLLLFYLRALLRKPRFKKNAMVNPTYYGEYGDEVPKSGQQLREKTFLAWFARWFLPGAEQNAIGFPNPKVDAITFVATRSGNTVVIPKKCINKSTMVVDGYDPEIDTDLSKSVKLGGNGTIVILDRNGDKLGYLTFMPHDEYDGIGYKAIVGILIALDVLTAIAMLVMTIRGLF